MSQQQAYKIDSARAIYDDGFLIIHAVIEVTATNYEPLLERSPILIFPPPNAFFAFERQTAPLGGQMIIPKAVTQTFPQAGGKPDFITIAAKTNKIDVKVLDIDPLAPSTQVLLGVFKEGQEGSAVAAGGGEVPSAHKEMVAFRDVATGYSSTFSFEDAFEDAVRKLPPNPAPVDSLTSVRVSGIGGEFGGIAGIRRMWVSVIRITVRT